MSDLNRLSAATPAGFNTDLNFRARTALAAGRRVPLSGLLQVARTSAAGYFGPGGVWQTVDANVPRFPYAPATGRQRGLLVEPAGVNLLPTNAVNDFASGWSLTGLAAFSASGRGLDARSTRLVESGAGQGVATKTLAIPVAAGPVLASVYLRPGNSNVMRLNANLTGGNAGLAGGATFDVRNGVLIAQDANTGATIEPGPDRSWRCSIVLYNGVQANQLIVGMQADAGQPNPRSWDAFAAQVELSFVPTTFMQPAPPRGADSVSVPLASLGFEPAEGTMIVECVPGGDPSVGQQIAALRNDSGSDFIFMSRSNLGPTQAVTMGTPAAQATVYGAPNGASLRLALAWIGTSWLALKSGGGADYLGAGALAFTGPIPGGLVSLDVGHLRGASQITGTVGRLLLAPRAMSTTEMSALIS